MGLTDQRFKTKYTPSRFPNILINHGINSTINRNKAENETVIIFVLLLNNQENELPELRSADNDETSNFMQNSLRSTS